MNKLKKYFLEFKNKRYKESNTTPRINIDYSKAKSVGILFNSENLQTVEGLTNFVKQLLQDGKQVKAITFQNLEQKDNLKVFNFNHHIISEKDISMTGEIKSFLVDDFIKTEFDYLFCIDTKPMNVFENILLKSKAKCRIGKYIEAKHYFELMIKINDNDGTDALMQQMLYYVKTIKND